MSEENTDATILMVALACDTQITLAHINCSQRVQHRHEKKLCKKPL